DQYKDNIPVLDLPVDQPRVSNQEYKGEQLQFLVENNTFEGIVKLSRESKCSSVTTLLSAFELFLYTQTKQKEVVVGLPISVQVGSFFGLVGHCVNLLPIRSKIDSRETFSQYLKRRTSQLYSDYDHQKVT